MMMKSLLTKLFTLLFLQTTSTITTVNAQVVHIAEIQQAQAANKAAAAAAAITTQTSPFLSTTLSTKITLASSSSLSSPSPVTDFFLDTKQKSIISETLTHFYTKIFTDQTTYPIKIISVVLFDDHILSKKNGQAVNNNIVAKSRQQSQQQPVYDGDNNDEHHNINVVSYTTVISGEYTTDVNSNNNQIMMISNDEFHKMLIHVTTKFQDHLLKYLHDVSSTTTSDSTANFGNVKSVVLDDFEKIGSSSGSSSSSSDVEIMGMSMTQDTVHIASIIAIVISGLVFVVLSFATVRYHKKAKQLKAARWRSKEAASMHNNVGSSSGLGLGQFTNQPMDDYSFDPLGGGANSSNGMYNNSNGQMSQFTSYRDDSRAVVVPSNNNNITTNGEEEIAFSSVWPQSAPPATLFPAPGATAAVASPPKKLSYTQELQNLPKQHVFAPPGKIGVAIDVLNGQPVVHKVRSGSPLENMLQPNDIIMAIDGVNTACMSAADVTSLMVRRMDRVRKITFVRRT